MLYEVITAADRQYLQAPLLQPGRTGTGAECVAGGKKYTVNAGGELGQGKQSGRLGLADAVRNFDNDRIDSALARNNFV